eukprot:1502558-Rhodomonas_salina.1
MNAPLQDWIAGQSALLPGTMPVALELLSVAHNITDYCTGGYIGGGEWPGLAFLSCHNSEAITQRPRKDSTTRKILVQGDGPPKVPLPEHAAGRNGTPYNWKNVFPSSLRKVQQEFLLRPVKVQQVYGRDSESEHQRATERVLLSRRKSLRQCSGSGCCGAPLSSCGNPILLAIVSNWGCMYGCHHGNLTAPLQELSHAGWRLSLAQTFK